MSLLKMQGAMLRPRSGDPHWNSVVALLHLDGSNGSTSYVDETGRNWSGGSGAQISTAQSMFGGASALLNGTVNTAFISTPDSPDLDFGAGNFTIELFFRASAITGFRILASKDDTLVPSNRGWLLLVDGTAGSVLRFSARVGTTSHVVEWSTPPAVNTWYHVAVVRDGGTLRMYVNGVQVNSTAIAGAINAPGVSPLIGNAHSGVNKAGAWSGHIDEVRITKGVCRYPGGATFTPPSEPFPAE